MNAQDAVIIFLVIVLLGLIITGEHCIKSNSDKWRNNHCYHGIK